MEVTINYNVNYNGQALSVEVTVEVYAASVTAEF